MHLGVYDVIKTLKEILLKKETKDEWTLGSDSSVEIFLARVSPEEIKKAVEINIVAATKARREYAKTIYNIMSNSENWHRLTKGE